MSLVTISNVCYSLFNIICLDALSLSADHDVLSSSKSIVPAMSFPASILPPTSISCCTSCPVDGLIGYATSRLLLPDC